MIDIKIASDSTLTKENCRGKNRTVNVYITCVKFLGGVCKLSKSKEWRAVGKSFNQGEIVDSEYYGSFCVMNDLYTYIGYSGRVSILCKDYIIMILHHELKEILT